MVCAIRPRDKLFISLHVPCYRRHRFVPHTIHLFALKSDCLSAAPVAFLRDLFSMFIVPNRHGNK